MNAHYWEIFHPALKTDDIIQINEKTTVSCVGDNQTYG